MKVYDAIVSRRSIRRFEQKRISTETLKKLVNAARLAPSAANLQPLEFFVVSDKKLGSEIFKTLSWAGYLKPKFIPKKTERPAAYIIIIGKNPKNNLWFIRDASIAAENIVLAAEGEGLGSCILLKIDKEKLRDIIKIPKEYKIDSLIALGYKAEEPVVEYIKNDDVRYWLDEEDVLHVPKRKIKDIIHFNKF
jgi:nitroreductase